MESFSSLLNSLDVMVESLVFQTKQAVVKVRKGIGLNNPVPVLLYSEQMVGGCGVVKYAKSILKFEFEFEKHIFHSVLVPIPQSPMSYAVYSLVDRVLIYNL